jgi:hypothetical protein
MCGLKKQMRVFDVELIESCRNAQICDESMYMVTAECPGDHPPAGVGLREKTEGAFVRGRGRFAAKGMRGLCRLQSTRCGHSFLYTGKQRFQFSVISMPPKAGSNCSKACVMFSD